MYNPAFLKVIAPLYDMHMGVENMGPMLYSLVRFQKPTHVLEIGAGYTSIFLLQALKDNYDELVRYQELIKRDECHCDGTPWCVDGFMEDESKHFGRLACVDNLAHAATTAHKVVEAAEKLELLDHLDLYFKDAWEYMDDSSGVAHNPAEHVGEGAAASSTTAPPLLDMAWLDFGQGEKLGLFVEKVWARLRPGGLVLCHSTLTNTLTRTWLEKMRSRANDVTDVFGSFATMSFREPHKLFQNSFSIFQKRKDYQEPTFTKYP